MPSVRPVLPTGSPCPCSLRQELFFPGPVNLSRSLSEDQESATGYIMLRKLEPKWKSCPKPRKSASAVTRRDLGVALASITAMEACRRSPRQKYTGALNGFNDKVDTAAFNPMLHTRKLQESAPLRMTFRAKTRAEAEQWQKGRGMPGAPWKVAAPL